MVADLVKRLQQFFKLDFLSRGGKSVIGVDIGSSSIKVVQLRNKGGVAVLETYGEISLGPYANLEVGQAAGLTTEKVALALTDVMREANVTSRIGGVSIPFTSSLVTLIQMPSLSKRKLAKMIPLEARKYIPVPIGEVALDWFIVPKRGEGITSHGEEEKKEQGGSKVDVLLVAIHNEVLNRYREIAEAAKLDVSFYEIEVFSSIRASVGQTLSPTAVLDIGAAKTKLYIVEYGIVRISYLINRGGQDITSSLSRSLGMDLKKAEVTKREYGLEGSDEKTREAMMLALDYIFAEANRALLSYQQKYNRNLSQVVLTGGGAVLKGLLPLAQSKLETEVVLGDPFVKIETPAFLESLLKQVGPEFSVAVGLALRKLQEME